MKVIHLKNDKDVTYIKEGLALAIGYFDGIHEGHRVLINKAKDSASKNNLKSGVITFYPNPAIVLGLIDDVTHITPLDLKVEVINSLDVDYLFIIEFNTFVASMLPKTFIETYIKGLNVKHLVFGDDWHYGRRGMGNKNTIEEHADNFTFEVIEIIKEENEKVSSTRIKDLLKNGEIEKANKFLERPYTVEGQVIYGKRLGNTIGFPTANLKFDNEYIIPFSGVYIVDVSIDGKTWHKGMANIGFNPTFNKLERKNLEIHILDFNEDIYDKKLRVRFYKRLREEKDFKSIDNLVKQLNKDKENTYNYFNKKTA